MMKVMAAQNLPWCSNVISCCCSHPRNWQIVAIYMRGMVIGFLELADALV